MHGVEKVEKTTLSSHGYMLQVKRQFASEYKVIAGKQMWNRTVCLCIMYILLSVSKMILKAVCLSGPLLGFPEALDWP